MRQHREDGAAAVEMALIMPVLFMLLFGIVVFGITLFRQQGLEAAVREGGRLAAVSVPLGDVKSRVEGQQQFDAADLLWTIAVDGIDQGSQPTDYVLCQTAGSSVRIGVQLDPAKRAEYDLSVPFLPAFTPAYQAEATFRCE